MTLDALYDTTSEDDWVIEWNASINNYSEAAALTHYSEEFNEWSYMINGTVCHQDVNNTNVTHPCSMDILKNKIHLRVPHFSGVGPQISGSTVAVASSDSGSSGGSSGGGSSSSGSSTTSSGITGATITTTSIKQTSYFSEITAGESISLPYTKDFGVTSITLTVNQDVGKSYVKDRKSVV